MPLLHNPNRLPEVLLHLILIFNIGLGRSRWSGRSVDTRGRSGVKGRGERGGATGFDLAFLAVEVEGVDIEQERFLEPYL